MKILHPTDFSECAEQARTHAVELARALDAELILFHVSVQAPLYAEGLISMKEVQQVFEAQRKWAEETLEARAGEMRGAGIITRWEIAVGVPFEEIVKAAEKEKADLIVMGTHGRHGLERLLVGSVATRVLRTAPCPVLTVREKREK
jgi:nucleotide-binding universal stress UspA family protein